MNMVDSLGKKLSQARHRLGLTIDEAAHATKLRPDKIAALEDDDYGRFANNIYARGFLQIYGRFLDVDVSDFARTLDNANPISVSDYQYLNNARAPREPVPERRERQRPSVAPLLFFVVVVVLGLGGAWIYANYQRIASKPAAPAANATPSDENLRPAQASPAPEITAKAPAFAAPKLAGPTSRVTALQRPTVPVPAGAVAITPIKAEPPRGPDQDFVSPKPVATSEPAAGAPPVSGLNVVLVASVKKTWVIIRKDNPKGPPIFEDYVYPNVNPLKLKGARFFIEARDPNAVQITMNGLPYAYQAAGVPVQ
jgi:cytoskeletal protein RodZ